MSEKTLRVRNLSYKKILTKVDFDLSQNNIIAVMGANGSGKSTLARLLCGLVSPSEGEISLIENERILPWNSIKRWQEVALVGQHPKRQIIGSTVADELSFGLLNMGLNAHEVKNKVVELAEFIGLDGRLLQSPSTLSGGERQRLILAAVLAIDPSFLILDESFSMLDQLAQKYVMELLKKASIKSPIGQLWITHDPEIAKQADHILLMKDGELVNAGTPGKILNDQNLCQELGIRGCMSKCPDSLSLYNKLYSTPPLIYSTSTIDSLKKNELKIDCTKEYQPRNNLINERIKRDRESNVLVFNNVYFSNGIKLSGSIKKGEFLAILGPSGAGKTTILAGIAGLKKPVSGEISVSKPLGVRLLQQEAGEYLIGRTVYDEVFYTLDKKARLKYKDSHENYIRTFGIPDNKIHLSPENLSGGERQKVALCAALESSPQILLLDEPLIGLDARSREEFLEHLKNLKGDSTIVYVTHDLDEILPLVNRIWLLESGEIIKDLWVNDRGRGM